MGIFYWCPDTGGQRLCGSSISSLVNAIICLIIAGTSLHWWLNLDSRDTRVVYQFFYYGYLIISILFFTIVILISIALYLPQDNRKQEGAAIIITLMALIINVIVILVTFICLIIHCATSSTICKSVGRTLGVGLMTLFSVCLFLDLNSYYEELSDPGAEGN